MKIEQVMKRNKNKRKGYMSEKHPDYLFPSRWKNVKNACPGKQGN